MEDSATSELELKEMIYDGESSIERAQVQCGASGLPRVLMRKSPLR